MGQRLGREVLHRAAQRRRLQDRADLVDLADLARGERGDRGAPIGLVGHQPLGLELPQRLAHGDVADLELGRDLVLGQRLIAPQLAGGDRLAERGRHQFVGRLARRAGAPIEYAIQIQGFGTGRVWSNVTGTCKIIYYILSYSSSTVQSPVPAPGPTVRVACSTPIRQDEMTRNPTGPVARQPIAYPLTRQFVEPDWNRLPGYRGVSREDWESALWQRRHTVKNLKEFKAVFGDLLPESLADSIARDHEERATMSMLIPPHMLNTMNVSDLWEDPVRRYMAPAFDDRRHGLAQPSHGLARQPARSRHVEGRGADPPVPDQGPGRDAVDLPAVLRALHPHGPGRQRRAAGRQAQVRDTPRRSVTSRSSTT